MRVSQGHVMLLMSMIKNEDDGVGGTEKEIYQRLFYVDD
jgi:hypothetical protein